jgi:hypothetical protein
VVPYKPQTDHKGLNGVAVKILESRLFTRKTKDVGETGFCGFLGYFRQKCTQMFPHKKGVGKQIEKKPTKMM